MKIFWNIFWNLILQIFSKFFKNFIRIFRLEMIIIESSKKWEKMFKARKNVWGCFREAY